MPYYTDTVASFTLLKSVIETNCVANGWTLSDGILSKDSCFFKLIDTGTTQLELWGGLSKTGSTLNNTPTYGVRLYNISTSITFPIRYHLFIFNNPIEVYCFIEYGSGYFQQISFGKSNLQGIGLGAWFTGFSTTYSSYSSPTILTSDEGPFVTNASAYGGGNASCGLFIGRSYSTISYSSYIYSDIDGSGWKYNNYTSGLIPAGVPIATLLNNSPNLFNNAAPLWPIKAVLPRSSGGLTILANLINSRLLRIDNHESKSLVTFGSEQWMVFPWYKRDILNRSGLGSTAINHSGTYGFAIKYEV